MYSQRKYGPFLTLLTWSLLLNQAAGVISLEGCELYFPLFCPHRRQSYPLNFSLLFPPRSPFIAAIRLLFTQPIQLQALCNIWLVCIKGEKGRVTKVTKLAPSEGFPPLVDIGHGGRTWSLQRGPPRPPFLWKVNNNYSWQLWWLAIVLTALKRQIVVINVI